MSITPQKHVYNYSLLSTDQVEEIVLIRSNAETKRRSGDHIKRTWLNSGHLLVNIGPVSAAMSSLLLFNDGEEDEEIRREPLALPLQNSLPPSKI